MADEYYEGTHTGEEIDAAVDFTQNFDTAPASGSNAGITSGGVYDALSKKQNNLTFDSTPTSGSANPVTSGGVYSAMNDVSSGTPTADSTYVGTSSTWWYRIGKLVIVSVAFAPQNMYAWERRHSFSGLPKCAGEVHVPAQFNSSNTTAVLEMESGGTDLYLHYMGVCESYDNSYVYGHFCYFAAD